MTQNKTYLSGLPEAVAKFVAFAITTLFFIVYAWALGDKKVILAPLEVLQYLALFWFLYESFSFITFLVLSYFDKASGNKLTKLEEKIDLFPQSKE